MLVGIHALASGVVGSALSDHIGADIFTIQSMIDNFITELIACCHKAELIICGAYGQIIFSHQSIVDFIQIDGKPHFVYSWKLEPTDQLPKGKKPCLSLRELEKQIKTQVAVLTNMPDGTMTVCELVDRYLQTKTGVRQSTRQGYITVQRILEKQAFGKMKIRSVKTSEAKLFLIKLQKEDGRNYSSIHTIRGVLRPAF